MLVLDFCSGSAIVTDVNTGDVKAYVSYPSYDNNYLTNEVDSGYYTKLLNDKTRPLYNRASQQLTAPGSSYKPLVSIAGLSEEVIDTCSSIISDMTLQSRMVTTTMLTELNASQNMPKCLALVICPA